MPLHASGEGWWCRDSQDTGLCVITYRPELICTHVRRRMDVCITLDSDRRAFLLRAEWPKRRAFDLAQRSTGHVRHWHKYSAGQLPPERHFVFRDRGGPIGLAAGNVEEFAEALEALPMDALRHHARHGDFSRWLGDICRTSDVRRTVGEIEGAIATSGSSREAAALRKQLQDVVRSQIAPSPLRFSDHAAAHAGITLT